VRKTIQWIAILILTALIMASSANCSGDDPVDVEATVQAGIAGTQTTEAGLNESINEAVAATLTAIPVPTPAALEQVSEETAAVAVESSVDEAVQASDQASAATADATADGALTEAELEELYYLYYLTLEETEQALALAGEYSALYSDLLDLTISELEDLEAELQLVLDTTNEVIAALDDIALTVEQGGLVAQQTLDNLQQLNQQISENAGMIRDHVPGWQNVRAQEFNRLADQALSIAPNEIAGSRAGALAQVRDYVQAAETAISDGRFSLAELNTLSQLGANASASLNQFGGDDLIGFPNAINSLTGSFARGQLLEVDLVLGSLQNSLPSFR